MVNHPEEVVNDLLKGLDKDLKNLAAQMDKKMAAALVTALMRTSLLYVYLVMTLYYIILMEAEDLLSRPMAILGKFFIFLTIAVYLMAEYFVPSKEMYVVITRMAVILFILSVSCFFKY